MDKRYLLAEEPAGAKGVIEARASLQANGPSEIVVRGRIGGNDGEVWDGSRAVFTILDDSMARDGAKEREAAHKPDGCPFCRAKERKVLEATAMIEMRDEQGNVPPIDARHLLGLRDGQSIVVVGEGQINDIGMFVIQARAVSVTNGP